MEKLLLRSAPLAAARRVAEAPAAVCVDAKLAGEWRRRRLQRESVVVHRLLVVQSWRHPGRASSHGKAVCAQRLLPLPV